MNALRLLLPLFLVLVSANSIHGQNQRSSNGVGSVGPTRVLDKRAKRLVTVKLRSGDVFECNFVRADEQIIEIDVGGERRELSLDDVDGIDFGPQAAGASRGVTPRRSAPLLVTARHCETFKRFTSLKGEVMNTSGRRINGLTAVGTFRNRAGAVVKVEDRMIGALAAGETSTFNVMWWYDPRIESCSVSFRIFGGKSVAHTESLQ